MTGNMKSNERIHYKIQVCLRNLALRKLKKSVAEIHVNSNETMNMRDQANSNLKPLNFESSSTEFSTSKERVDLLQDFQSQELQLDIRNLSKEPRRAVEQYIRIKENGHAIKTGMVNDTILLRNVHLSLPILQVEPLENMSFAKMTCLKLAIKNYVNVKNNGDGDVPISEINREISKKETQDNVSFHGDSKKDVHEKEIGDTAKLESQDASKIGQTPSDNPIMNRKQLMDSRHYLEIGTQEKKSMENIITNSPCLKMINEPAQSILKRTNEKYSSFDDSTLDWKFCKACSLIQNQNCALVSSESMAHIENDVQNKQIPVDGKRHFHRSRNRNEVMKHHTRFNPPYSFLRKYQTNKDEEHTSSYLVTYINENIKDNTRYQCVRRYCGENMINDSSRFQCCYRGDYNTSYERWDIQKGMLGSTRNEYRRHICKVRGNSSISCGCKCKVTPSSQRVTFCLPGKKETT